DWTTVAACHPAVAVVGDIDPELAPLAADHLVVAARALGDAQPWDELHRRWGEPDATGHAGLAPHEVRWMDPGMLSRWCLSLLPDVDDLVDAAAALLSEAVIDNIRGALVAWDIGPG